MATNFWKVKKGINLDTSNSGSVVSTEGDVAYNSTSHKLEVKDNSATRSMVSEDATQTLTNKTLTGNTAVNLVSGSGTLTLNTSGTVTLPNATDTLVGKATTDVLTNKTLTGNTAVNLVSGSGTLTLNTSGTVTLPNATDTLVGKATTDTFTNKTFDAAGTGNTLSNVANANVSASAAIARSKLATGTTNHVVINDGSTGAFSSEAQLAKSRGGTGADNSSVTFPSSGTVQATTPNNHGVLVSGSGATATVIAPNASTVFPLVSGGSSADPGWSALTPGGGGTGQTSYTKGDTLVASAATTLNKLAVGSDGQVIVADSSQTNGLKWATLQQGAKNYITYNNFENNALTGWEWCNTGTLTNGIPTGTPNFSGVNANALYAFTITTSSTCAVGDTYTNNTQTFTVVTALSAQSGTVFFATGTGDPTASGNLTRNTGAGTSTIAYTAFTKETLSTVSSSQLAGSYSLSLATSGATTTQLGISTQSYAIDAEDQAKVLSWKFYYKAQTNPGNANWSGTSSNSLAVAVYDVTNSTWLQTAGQFNLIQSTGIGICQGTFQTASSTANLRFVIYNSAATSGAITVYFDDFYVGPQSLAFGPAMTDDSSVTLSPSAGFGTTTLQSTWASRHGNWARFRGYFKTGTTAASTASLGLPSGYVIDSSKFASTTNAQRVGTWDNINNGASGSASASVLFYDGSDTANIYLAINGASGALTKANGSTLLGTNDAITYDFILPISGWSSNTSMSADTDTRVVAAQASLSTNTAITAGNAITFNTIASDTHGAYNSGTGVYTVQVSGYYRVSYTAQTTSGNSGIYVSKNGSAQGFLGIAQTSPTGGSQTFKCSAGDTLSIISQSSVTFSGGTGTSNLTLMSIERLSGPAVVAATESVNMRYTDTSGTSVTNGTGTYTYPTKGYDSHNAYSSGTYTVPVSGKYSVKAAIQLVTTAAFSVGAGRNLTIFIQHNGSTFSEMSVYAQSTNSTPWPVMIADTVNCVAGDTIVIAASQNIPSSGGVATTTAGGCNWVAIERVGN